MPLLANVKDLPTREYLQALNEEIALLRSDFIKVRKSRGVITGRFSTRLEKLEKREKERTKQGKIKDRLKKSKTKKETKRQVN